MPIVEVNHIRPYKLYQVLGLVVVEWLPIISCTKPDISPLFIRDDLAVVWLVGGGFAVKDVVNVHGKLQTLVLAQRLFIAHSPVVADMFAKLGFFIQCGFACVVATNGGIMAWAIHSGGAIPS